jgi:cell wall-associated NlpC family hydrolase
MSAVEQFVACARAQVGKAYAWATAGPNTFDCSGLVAFCYEQATGETITRSSYEQMALGIPTRFPVKGTLLFWDTEHNGTAGHVAIAVGNGEVVHAMNPQRGVIVSQDTAQMGGPFLGARLLFTDTTPAPTPEPPPNPKPGRDRDRQRQRERDRIRRRRRKA